MQNTHSEKEETKKKTLSLSEMITIGLSIIAIGISIIALVQTWQQNEIGKKGSLPSIDVRASYSDNAIDNISIVNTGSPVKESHIFLYGLLSAEIYDGFLLLDSELETEVEIPIPIVETEDESKEPLDWTYLHNTTPDPESNDTYTFYAPINLVPFLRSYSTKSGTMADIDCKRMRRKLEGFIDELYMYMEEIKSNKEHFKDFVPYIIVPDDVNYVTEDDPPFESEISGNIIEPSNEILEEVRRVRSETKTHKLTCNPLLATMDEIKELFPDEEDVTFFQYYYDKKEATPTIPILGLQDKYPEKYRYAQMTHFWNEEKGDYIDLTNQDLLDNVDVLMFLRIDYTDLYGKENSVIYYIKPEMEDYSEWDPNLYESGMRWLDTTKPDDTEERKIYDDMIDLTSMDYGEYLVYERTLSFYSPRHFYEEVVTKYMKKVIQEYADRSG